MKVEIDAANRIWFSTDLEGEQGPLEIRQLRSIIRNTKTDFDIERVTVRADVESIHERVIQVMDIVNKLGFPKSD